MLAVCNFTSQYIRVQPTPTSDRLCGLLEVCDPDEYERIAPTTTSDRDCKECDVCDEETQIEDAPCTSTSNAVCRNITESYTYGPWSAWSIACDIQERTRTESCADVKCLNPLETRQTRSINGGCEDVCDDTGGSIECSCTPPAYLISDVACSSVFCDIPALTNASVNATGQLRLDEAVRVTCDEGYASSQHGNSFLMVCTQNSFVNENATCKDVDECATNNGGCASGCTNLPGTYCCQQDGVYAYSEWTDWSTSCGFGMRTRTRTCNATCNGVCTNDLPLVDTRNTCCPVNASFTYGAYPAWQPTCERQTRERPETCEASCGGVCFGRINTTQVLVNGGCEQLCEDSSGNIVCGCTAGFRLTADNTTCEEFNPCDENNGGCSDTCVPGALDQFECTCPSGFEALDGFNCEDVDECLVSNGGCDQHCNNTAGSYFCSCRSGFMVAPSNSSECLPITCDDPPSTLPAASPNATATLTDSEPFEFGDDITYTCSPGYTVDGESVSATTLTLRCRADGDVSGVFEDGCVDVDECSDGVNGGCEVYCTNTAGSYESA